MLVVKLTRISYVFYFIFTLTSLILHILSFVKNKYVIFWENSVRDQIHHIGFQKLCTTDVKFDEPIFCGTIQDAISGSQSSAAQQINRFNSKLQTSLILFIVASVSIFINLLCALVKFQTEFNRTFCPMPRVNVTVPTKPDNNTTTVVDNASLVDNNTKLNPSIVEKKNSNNILWILTLTVWSLVSFIFDVLGLHFIWPSLYDNRKLTKAVSTF